MSPINETRPVIDGVGTRALMVDGTGPTLVLVHGFTDTADCWRPVLDRMAQVGRRAVAVDLPGHGQAERPRSLRLAGLDSFVAATVREYAGAGTVVLAGNSLGGLLALRAASDPDLPLDSVAGLGPAGLAHHRRLQVLVIVASILHPGLRLIDRWLPVPEQLVRRRAIATYLRLTRGRASSDLVTAYADGLRGRDSVARMRTYLVELSREIEANPVRLESVRVPVLLLWGRHDGLADLSGAPLLLDRVPSSRLVVLEDAGHCPQIDLPDEVADLLGGLPQTAAPTS